MLTLANPDPLSLQQLLAIIPTLSGSAVLVLVCYAFYSGKIVRRGELDKSEARAEKSEAMVLELLGFAKRSQHTADRATEIASEFAKSSTRSSP